MNCCVDMLRWEVERTDVCVRGSGSATRLQLGPTFIEGTVPLRALATRGHQGVVWQPHCDRKLWQLPCSSCLALSATVFTEACNSRTCQTPVKPQEAPAAVLCCAVMLMPHRPCAVQRQQTGHGRKAWSSKWSIGMMQQSRQKTRSKPYSAELNSWK